MLARLSSPARPTLTYTRLRNDITCTVETITDLGTVAWSCVAVDPNGAGTSVTASYRSPVPAPSSISA